ncbi:MAG TPA: hypothetical protein VGD57_09435, partial [Candidatus Dormibacteraeota bacterium]
MPYRLLQEFRQASTRLDTPPFSNRHHPVSRIALPRAELALPLDRRIGRFAPLYAVPDLTLLI